MTPAEKTLVQTTFATLVPIADQAAALFYRRLFEIDPSLRPLFTSDLGEQGNKLMTMIGVAVKGLDTLDELVPAVKNLGPPPRRLRRHRRALRHRRRRAVVDAGEGARLRLHARREGGLDHRLHGAREDDEGGRRGPRLTDD